MRKFVQRPSADHIADCEVIPVLVDVRVRRVEIGVGRSDRCEHSAVSHRRAGRYLPLQARARVHAKHAISERATAAVEEIATVDFFALIGVAVLVHIDRERLRKTSDAWQHQRDSSAA